MMLRHVSTAFRRLLSGRSWRDCPWDNRGDDMGAAAGGLLVAAAPRRRRAESRSVHALPDFSPARPGGAPSGATGAAAAHGTAAHRVAAVRPLGPRARRARSSWSRCWDNRGDDMGDASLGRQARRHCPLAGQGQSPPLGADDHLGGFVQLFVPCFLMFCLPWSPPRRRRLLEQPLGRQGRRHCRHARDNQRGLML